MRDSLQPDRSALVFIVSLGAGLMDAVTGLCLIVAPAVVLRLLGAPMPAGGDDVLMRFVGAFVCGVGCAYLWGMGTADVGKRLRQLEGVWGATALIRLCVALFTCGAVLLGRLAPLWLVVSLTDGVLGVGQLAALRAGWCANKRGQAL